MHRQAPLTNLGRRRIQQPHAHEPTTGQHLAPPHPLTLCFAEPLALPLEFQHTVAAPAAPAAATPTWRQQPAQPEVRHFCSEAPLVSSPRVHVCARQQDVVAVEVPVQHILRGHTTRPGSRHGHMGHATAMNDCRSAFRWPLLHPDESQSQQALPNSAAQSTC